MHKHNEAGFTLSELLVSTVVTLMVLAAALGSFSDAVRVTDAARETTDTNQNLEVATTLLVRDLIQAGQGIPPGGIYLPSGAGATAITRPSPAGSDMTFPLGTEVLPSLTPGASLGPLVLGVQTDMIHVLYEDPTLSLKDASLTIPNDGSRVTVNDVDITGQDRIQAGDLILFRGNNNSALQMVTSTDDQTMFFAAGDPMNLNQRGAAQGTVLFVKAGQQFNSDLIDLYRVHLITYYIDATTDPLLPRLVRQVGMGPRLAIALGIENIQFTYDLVDGDTNPTNLQDALAPNAPHQIRKANLFLAGRSIDVNPRTRQFYRNTVATQVSLRSLAFVDRYNNQ